jgi:hypothetical protein
MAEEPDRIKDDIDATRSSLVRDVDALADRTLPNRVVRRRWETMKERVQGVSDKVMGTSHDVASDAGDKVSAAASAVADNVREAPEAISRKTQGNPIAAGIIAFGTGLLAASLMPATELERRAGQQLKDSAGDVLEPIREPLAQSAQQLKEGVTDSASDAAHQVMDSARQAARTTTAQAKDAATSTP